MLYVLVANIVSFRDHPPSLNNIKKITITFLRNHVSNSTNIV